MRTVIGSYVVATALLGASQSVLAIAHFQPSGLIDMPTARILPHRVPVISTSFSMYSSATQFHSKGSETLNLGLFDWAEVGFFAESEQKFAGAVKIRVAEEGRFMPDLAIGVQNLFGPDDISEYGQDFWYADGQANSCYMVMSKRVNWLPELDMSFHAGIGSGRFRGVQTTSNGTQGVFIGMEAWVTDHVRLSFEEDGADGNLGASFYFNETFAAHVALSEFESAFHYDRDPSSNDPKVHPKVVVAMNYTFDFLRPPLARKQSKIREIQRQQEENRVLLDELEGLRARRRDAEARIEAYRAALGADDRDDTDTGE